MTNRYTVVRWQEKTRQVLIFDWQMGMAKTISVSVWGYYAEELMYVR